MNLSLIEIQDHFPNLRAGAGPTRKTEEFCRRRSRSRAKSSFLPSNSVAECANDQGRFEAMYDALFEGQDRFGLKPWDEYAIAAGVPDMAAFDACIKKTDPIPRVEEGKALGAELDQMVRRILAGNQPVDAKSWRGEGASQVCTPVGKLLDDRIRWTG